MYRGWWAGCGRKVSFETMRIFQKRRLKREINKTFLAATVLNPVSFRRTGRWKREEKKFEAVGGWCSCRGGGRLDRRRLFVLYFPTDICGRAFFSLAGEVCSGLLQCFFITYTEAWKLIELLLHIRRMSIRIGNSIFSQSFRMDPVRLFISHSLQSHLQRMGRHGLWIQPGRNSDIATHCVPGESLLSTALAKSPKNASSDISVITSSSATECFL